PTREDLAKLDRNRAKKGSNEEWEHPDDPDAKITKMKDGRTHLAHKAEHAVDMETGAVLAVTLQDANAGDTTASRMNRLLLSIGNAPTAFNPTATTVTYQMNNREADPRPVNVMNLLLPSPRQIPDENQKNIVFVPSRSLDRGFSAAR